MLTLILHHLREVDRRKLFSDLGYQSLFDYCVRELGYSEGQAGRRIQAMRLMRELPEIEDKIRTGNLSLSNLSQAQSHFRLAGKTTIKEKTSILTLLENKSAREGQKVLLSLEPRAPLPKERERPLSESHSEVRFVMSEELRTQLEEVRSLLGPKGAKMSLAELLAEMAGLSAHALKEKKFGKKRVRAQNTPTPTPTPTPASESPKTANSRKASRADQFKVWERANGKCERCGSKRNLNLDHKLPYALGGLSTAENLRLLCQHCNQRAAIKVFGLRKVGRQDQRSVQISKTKPMECPQTAD